MNRESIKPETITRVQQLMERARLSESDIDEFFIRGSGAGGQKINKTSSCVQLRHLPSGQIVKCQLTRSRETNRWLARKLLAERLLEQIAGELSARQQLAAKIRRQKQRRSRRQRALLVEGKRRQATKKALRRPVDDYD